MTDSDGPPQAVRPPEDVDRPQGVTALAILAAVGGVIGLIGGLAVVGESGAFGTSAGVIAGLVAMGLGVLELAFAYGAWTLKSWGWILGIVVAVISLATSAIAVASGRSIVNQVASIAIAAVILYYLNTANVKAAFRRT
jgi:uncharacterized membrane protein (DUF2068 family)